MLTPGVVVEEGKTEDVINKPSDGYTHKLLNSIIAV